MNERFYRSIIEQSPVGYAHLEEVHAEMGKPRDYVFIEVNTAFEALTGLDRFEIIGKPVGSALPDIEEDVSDWVQCFDDIANNCGQREFDWFSEPLGKWYRVTVYSPECGYLVAHFVDVSERRRAERTVQEDATRFQSLFENMSSAAAIYEVENDGESGDDYIIKDFNAIALGLEGREKPEVLGRSLRDLRPNIDRYGLIPVFQRVWKTGEPEHFPAKVYLDENYHNWYENRVFRLPSGEIVAVYDDVTQGKTIEEERMQRERFLRTILETTQDGFLVLDGAGRIVDVNNSYCLMSGYTRDELVTMSIEDLDSDGGPQILRQTYDPADGDKAHLFETHHRRADGTHFDVEVSVTKVDSDLGSNVVCFLRDTTRRKVTERALKESEERHRRLFETMDQGVAYQSADGVIISANPAAEKILGLTLDEMRGKTSMDPAWKAIREDGSELPGSEHPSMIALRTGKEVRSAVMGIFHPKKNDHVWISINAMPMFRPGESFPHQVYTTFADITAQRNAETQLLQTVARLTSLLDNSPSLIMILDETGRYVEVSASVADLFGLSKQDIEGKSFGQLLPPAVAERFTQTLSLLKENRRPVQTTDLIEMGGKQRIFEGRLFPMGSSDRGLDLFGCIAIDVTTKKQYEDELLHLSYHDQLTGLYNRRFFEEECKRLDTARNLPLSIVLGDVNGLKLVNDSFGHAVGDELLMKAGEMIKAECRRDDILARTGGDEFAVILPRTDADAATRVVDRIKRSISGTAVANIELSISFGIDTKESETQAIEEVLANAENHMYRNKVYEHSSMRSKTIDVVMHTLFEKSNRESLHSARVSAICQSIAEQMGFSKDEVGQIRIAGLMHDTGKIGIDESILNKNGRLNDVDWKDMKKHPEIGWRILSSTNEFSEIADFVLSHQERWDGTGYPNGLRGDAIPLEARIIAVADAYDAMSGERDYRKPFDEDSILAEFRRCSGTQFDPAVVDVFINRVLARDDRHPGDSATTNG